MCVCMLFIACSLMSGLAKVNSYHHTHNLSTHSLTAVGLSTGIFIPPSRQKKTKKTRGKEISTEGAEV